MAMLNPDSSFQSWTLTPQEQEQGSILTTTQKQCIQNQIVQLAEEKISLTYDPINSLVFVQREAELQGAIKALRYLLDISSSTEETLLSRLQSSGVN